MPTAKTPLSPASISTDAKSHHQDARAPRPSWWPGKLVDAYLFGHVAEATLRGLGMFVMLLLFFAVITATRKLLDSSLSLVGAGELILYQLPRIFLFTLPMATLYGTLHAFAELSSKGEIIALWGGGMSFPRMLRAPIVWAIMLASTAYVVQETIVPAAETGKDRVLANQIAKSASVQRELDRSFPNKDGSILRLTADEFDFKSKTLVNPVVQLNNVKREFVSEFAAKSARWDDKIKMWVGEGVRVKKWGGVAGETETETTESGSSRVEFAGPDPQELGKRALTRTENLLKANYEFVSIADLEAWRRGLQMKIASPETKSKDRAKFTKMRDGATFGIHDKIATPLICVALVLIAAPLGLRPQRSTGGFSLGLSLLILLFYYVVWTWATQVGKAGIGNPYLLAYLPLILTLVAGTIFTWKKSR